jgi:hypothetical protein
MLWDICLAYSALLENSIWGILLQQYKVAKMGIKFLLQTPCTFQRERAGPPRAQRPSWAQAHLPRKDGAGAGLPPDHTMVRLFCTFFFPGLQPYPAKPSLSKESLCENLIKTVEGPGGEGDCPPWLWSGSSSLIRYQFPLHSLPSSECLTPATATSPQLPLLFRVELSSRWKLLSPMAITQIKIQSQF